MNNIKLTQRLFAVMSEIPRCNRLADIGTDHAYIPMYAVLNGICDCAVAGDVVEGPVKIARNNVIKNRLSDKIEVLKADGLSCAKNSDVGVIAGMGGKLICDILQNDLDIAYNLDKIILQPMTCSFELRKFLHKNGFLIEKETLAKEDEKIYNIMVVKKGTQIFDDEFYYHIGKYLFDSKNPLLKEYLKHKAYVLKKRIDGMEKSSDEKIVSESKRLKKLLFRLSEEVTLCQQ